jgi:hypothetical protein
MVTKPSKIETQLERILPTVRKPGRYTGGELNQVVKDWSTIQTWACQTWVWPSCMKSSTSVPML